MTEIISVTNPLFPPTGQKYDGTEGLGSRFGLFLKALGGTETETPNPTAKTVKSDRGRTVQTRRRSNFVFPRKPKPKIDPRLSSIGLNVTPTGGLVI